jgi:hypothetical protein
VITREIQKFGEFTLRGRNSSGRAARKFVEELRQTFPQDDQVGESSSKAPLQEFDKIEKGGEVIVPSAQCGPGEPTHPFGTCVEDLFSHSWSNRAGSWLWVPKGSVLAAVERGLGHPATKNEIQKFGGACRRVVRVNPKRVDSRSFVEVAGMDRGRDPNRSGHAPSRLGDRVGSGRFGGFGGNSNQGDNPSVGGSGGFVDRGRVPSDGGCDFRGFGGGPNFFRNNSNKRQFDERERMEREEMDLRAKLRRE